MEEHCCTHHAPAAAPAPGYTGKWTCPMHPEIVRDGPGACPKCGMALEPMDARAAGNANPELDDMTRRLWIALALTVPIVILDMGGHFLGLEHLIPPRISAFIQFALATPVVAWAGAPFFERFWQSIHNRSLNMFTLIAMGTGVAWGYSTVATFAPGLFPMRFRMDGAVAVYFEAAAVITALVLVGQVLNAELEKLGLEVCTDICEHFPHTRQELYHLVRVNQIKSFHELQTRHGRGNGGCDICKPAVASILASCWNEHVLDRRHAGLQDTNDRYLGNLQKNGTYSIVPRIAGGEITPDKLIALGEVARRYDLYTKITGGQRIDLFGARVEQLPQIWEELIAAGFETGHAYGKAVRTVKSCVGNTWCRYGVDDSVGLALEIEHRYKGLRSPHKLKFAVSGCTRECAEAQSKDVGVIATEHGWNLYVCGNGGMRPRHADLFATDLERDTLIRYIDRFLMFYVRTADRLQRTSTWFESLDGGLDYLRAVVIDDSLGIGAQLEEEMAAVIGSYQCEWKTAVSDPEKRKLFRPFVNSDRPDEQVVFVREREQIRPAREEELEEGLPA